MHIKVIMPIMAHLYFVFMAFPNIASMKTGNCEKNYINSCNIFFVNKDANFDIVLTKIKTQLF